jgi:hypothetical protein
VRVLRQGPGSAFEALDGGSLVYSVGDRILRAPIAGGEGAPVAEIPPRSLWTLARSGIYLLDPDAEGGPAIERLSFAGLERKTLSRLPGQPGDYLWGVGTLAVSPDERLALFEHVETRDADIALVEGFR